MTIRSMLQGRYQYSPIVHIHFPDLESGDLLTYPVSKDWAIAYLFPLLADTTAWRWDRDNTSRWLMSTVGSPSFNDLLRKQVANGDSLFLDFAATSPSVREHVTDLLNGISYPERHHPGYSEKATAAQFEAWYNRLGGDPDYTGTTNQTTSNTTSNTLTKENTIMAQNTSNAVPLKVGFAVVKDGHVGQVSHLDKIIWQSEPVSVVLDGFDDLEAVAISLAQDAVAEFYRAAFSDITPPSVVKPLK